jgi:hypothetical protein
VDKMNLVFEYGKIDEFRLETLELFTFAFLVMLNLSLGATLLLFFSNERFYLHTAI